MDLDGSSFCVGSFHCPTVDPGASKADDQRSLTMIQEDTGERAIAVDTMPEAVRLCGNLPETFEGDVLHYQGKQRYLATWWSEDHQSVVWADGQTWQASDIDEDEWVWWTYTLALINSFDTDFLGYDLDLPLSVLLLDLDRRRIWLAPIGAACDFLRKASLQKQLGRP
jgi:ferredoxin